MGGSAVKAVRIEGDGVPTGNVEFIELKGRHHRNFNIFKLKTIKSGHFFDSIILPIELRDVVKKITQILF